MRCFVPSVASGRRKGSLPEAVVKQRESCRRLQNLNGGRRFESRFEPTGSYREFA